MGNIKYDISNDLYEYAVKCRRYLHSIAELSDMEFETSNYIYSRLVELGYTPVRIHTGMYVDITGYAPTMTVAVRSDMDALELVEQTGLPFACTNGCMHACGHDAHTAMCLALAGQLVGSQPKNNVRIIFQPAEEGSGGAAKMIDGGCLVGVDKIYALHLSPKYPLGQLHTKSGALFAGVVEFDVIVHGKSSHVATREEGSDAIMAGFSFAQQAQSMVSGYDNAILGIGKVQGGCARNIIADYAKLDCTMRYYSLADKESIMSGLGKLAANVDKQYGTTTEVLTHIIYPPLINSKEGVEEFGSVCELHHADAQYTAEDFAMYLQHKKGCMVWLGVRDDKHKEPLHSNKFDFDEKAMRYGINALVKICNID